MKKIIYPMMIMLVSFAIGYTWYHKKNKKYAEVNRIKPLCTNPSNCKKCQYYEECYGIDDDSI